VAFFIDKGVKMKKILGLALLMSLLMVSLVVAWNPPGGWDSWRQAMTTFGFSATDSSKTTMNKGLLMPAGAYVSFGTTYGTSGYGLRDNSGTPQYKASGGAWTDIGSGGSGAVATDVIWDAAGDLVQGTGANTGAKLSAGAAGKLLRAAGAGVAVDWSGYIIALPNTTNQFLQSDGTNWNATSNPSISTINLYGTNSLNLGTASSLTGQIVFKNAGGANTATLQSGTTSGSYTLNLPLAAVALGDVIVGSAANQLGVVSKGAAVAGVLGWDAAGTLAKYTSMSFDNTAAQFYDSVAPTKLVGIDPVGMTAGVTAWYKPVASTGPAIFTNNTVTAGTYKIGLLEVAGTWSGQQTFVAPILGTPASGVMTNATGFPASPPGIVERIGATFDGGGSAIAVNKIAFVHIPFAVTTINSWTVVCDQDSGTTGIIITPYMDAYAEDHITHTTMCTSGVIPHTSDGATAGGVTHQAAWDCNITAIPADSVVAFKVTTAPTSATWCTISLKVTR
jgi:hypothetical protein